MLPARVTLDVSMRLSLSAFARLGQQHSASCSRPERVMVQTPQLSRKALCHPSFQSQVLSMPGNLPTPFFSFR